MKVWIIAAVSVLSAAGSAQVNQSTPGSTPGSKKILASAYWRINQQKDAWFSDGDYPAAIQMLSVEALWRPYDYQTITDLGWMYGNIERPDLELAVYTRFSDNYPQDPEAWYPIAEFYYKLRQYQQVVTYLEPTMSMGSHPHANSYRILAHSYDRLGMFKQALEIWDAYLKIAPDDAAAKVNREKVAKKIDGN